MAKDEVTEKSIEAVESALDQSLWRSVAAFVKKCGGDVAKVSPEERDGFLEELAAWAVLACDEGDE